MLIENDDYIAGDCRSCSRILVMTKRHEDVETSREEVPEELYEGTARLAPGTPIEYSGKDRPRFHGPHEYVHVRKRS